MIRHGFFRFEHNNQILMFKPVTPHEGAIAKKFAFYVEGDEVLTNKILAAVKRKKVEKAAIYYKAKSIFSMIECNAIKPIASAKERQDLFSRFEKKYKEAPLFKVHDRSETKHHPYFMVELMNVNVPFARGIGRNIQEAKADSLRMLWQQESL